MSLVYVECDSGLAALEGAKAAAPDPTPPRPSALARHKFHVTTYEISSYGQTET